VAYTLMWYAAEEVLHLILKESLSPDEMKLINYQVMKKLDEASSKLTLLIDASDLTVGYATVEQLRKSQAYRDHPKLETIIVIASTKLNRLIMLLVFNLSRARFVQVENQERAQMYMTKRGFSPSPTVTNGH
jgi:hypothetical protein